MTKPIALAIINSISVKPVSFAVVLKLFLGCAFMVDRRVELACGKVGNADDRRHCSAAFIGIVGAAAAGGCGRGHGITYALPDDRYFVFGSCRDDFDTSSTVDLCSYVAGAAGFRRSFQFLAPFAYVDSCPFGE